VRGEGAVWRGLKGLGARAAARAPRGERDFRLVQGGCMCVSTSCASLCELASQVVYPFYFAWCESVNRVRDVPVACT